MMDDNEVLKYQKRARYVARKRGYPQLADDFAQQIFVYFGEKPDRGATLDQLFIDYLRGTYGRPGKPGGDARITAELTMVPIDDARDVAIDSEPEFISGQCAFLFGGREAEIYQHYFVDQEQEQEIARLLGVTPSRICQIIGSMKKQIQNHFLLEEARVRFESEPSFTQMRVDWITL